MRTDLVTDALDLVGIIMLIAAAAVALWGLHPALSLLAAGVGLLVASWILDRRARQ